MRDMFGNEVTVAKEIGLRGWTVRIDGAFVADFYREISARRLAMTLTTILARRPVPAPV